MAVSGKRATRKRSRKFIAKRNFPERCRRLIKSSRRGLLLLILFGIGLIVASCPQSLDNIAVKQVKDTVGPVVTITDPADGSAYAQTVVVQGIVSDKSTDTGEEGKAVSVTYRIIPETIPGGTVAFKDDGSFSFQFAIGEFDGPMVIVVNAEDWNGNIGSESVTLINAGNDIPSFDVEPHNKSVTLCWDEVSMSEEYTVYYTTDGTYPSENYGQVISDAVSPLTINGLQNGSKHVFLLHSHSSEGNDNWSDFIWTVPLSSETLVPTVHPKYQTMELNWADIMADDQYVVYRSVGSADATPIDISGPISGTHFIDSDVDQGISYYYRVALAGQRDLRSSPAWANLEYFPAADERVMGTVYTGPSVNRLDVSGDHAYIAGYGNGVHIVDISDPSEMQLVKTVLVPGMATDVDVEGDLMCVAVSGDGLYIADLTDPETPVELAVYDGPEVDIEDARGVTLNNQLAFISDSASTDLGIHIIDISTPSSPQYRSTYITPGYANSVDVEGNIAYIADYYSPGGLQAANISNPSNPSNAGSLTTYATSDVAVSGGFAYIADIYTGLRVINVTTNPFTLHTTYDTNHLWTYGIALEGNICCVADDSDGLVVLDVSTTPPTLLASHASIGGTRDVKIADSIAYTAERYFGMQAINLKAPTSLSTVTSVSLSDWGQDVVVRENYAYVMTSSGIDIIHVGDPTNASYVKTIPVGGSGRSIAVHGDKLLVSTWGALECYDLTDPENPSLVWSHDAIAFQTQALGDTVFLASRDYGLRVLDIAGINGPEVIGIYKSFRALGVAVAGDLAVVGDEQMGFKILDISTPSSPTLLHELDDTNEWARTVATDGRFAYVAQSGAGVRVIDLEDPGFPLIHTFSCSEAWDVEVHGNYLYIADYIDGLYVLDTTFLGDDDPATPELLQIANHSGGGYGLHVNGNYAYIARPSQLDVVRLSPEN